MPRSPLRPCTYPGCPRLVESGRCDMHRETRRSSSARGYDSDWNRFRLDFLERHRFCEIRTHCRGAFASDVDHIVPLREAPGRKYDETNLQAACSRCHKAKSAREGHELRRLENV